MHDKWQAAANTQTTHSLIGVFPALQGQDCTSRRDYRTGEDPNRRLQVATLWAANDSSLIEHDASEGSSGF
ncbi:hypothetical protein IAQ61_011373 [Plenodomus lingam]|uniref:Predicted protein n=1 Tax=Leptosphaeria maculans (strain JN3 / isolate v23.1.3 / race Av1-4-5-6-7-8) TaxID=985895 RepID=E5A9V6_LEPMJ|nr:predicted protein [Plenodomus lingam JN3]KAH9859592.1 hypothetical protein IAQ61_011373 [Plenodomus lingam]CBY00447.1 predicted protein [Plenodomus lingam JN3]